VLLVNFTKKGGSHENDSGEAFSPRNRDRGS